ncbi:MAG: hypothetical protein AW10_01992 [Candidatus Accumulibacter appositus]|uniref:Uncharacterized protein n=1 Tax=Candidatus Accumulibacter appositus TaxID=1454003 RepID=A0A011PSW1_9PROT|nr:hypothetical protein [Accumulibacter sp.]EXI80112.1 MAG: hypothetical protein AW10_01992 [Candidatus Accumulibacter appositus]HRF05568.1 hypothetical protein [Accumulibacter sp.]
MFNRKRPRVTLRVVLFALVDAVGILVFSSGAMWLARGQTLFIPNFPTSTPAALVTVVAGFALMLWATGQMLHEFARVAAKGADQA